MKVFIALFLGLALGVTGFVGAQEASSDEANEDGKTVVNVMFGNTGSAEIHEQVAEMFMEQNPDIQIELLEGAEQTDDLLALYLQFFEAQSSEVDVMQLDVVWPGIMSDFMVDLNEYGAAEVSGEYLPSIVENNTVDGKLLAIPWFTDVGLLYYRTDLLGEYGFDAPPTTWDELEEMAQAIQEGERADNPDFWGFVWQGEAYEGLSVDALEWIASHGGGTVVEEDGTVSINNDAAKAAVNRAKGWVDTISPPGVTGFNEEAARNFFQAGNAAFMRNWPYAYGLANAEDSPVSGLVDIALLPGTEQGDSSGVLGGWSLGVSKYSANPEAAAKVALFFASPEVQKMRSVEESFTPTVTSLFEDAEVLEANPFYDLLQQALDNAVARPAAATAPYYSDISRVFYSAVYDVITDTVPVDEAFSTLELDIQELLEEAEAQEQAAEEQAAEEQTEEAEGEAEGEEESEDTEGESDDGQ